MRTEVTLVKKGFTLIELLIVVAIIAILAAIAIPNFLAAQVRAKVSRAKGEMASLNTAMESYFVDNNTYPGCVVGYPGVEAAMYIPNSISTPISYISSNAINDPFRSAAAQPPYTRYRYLHPRSLYNPDTQQSVIDTYESIYGQWRISSSGPDRTAGPFSYIMVGGSAVWNTMPLYDPTNGTVSDGDIIRSQMSADGQYPFLSK